MLLTKRSLFDSATAYAEGGIAAALGAGDLPKLHSRDTLAAGAALCDEEAVRVLVEEGPSRVRELQVAGADFDLTPKGALRLGREAAHSRRRIVHSHGDRTGAEVARTLVERVRESKQTKVLERARALDLIVENGRCAGVRASVVGEAVEIRADATVLATGGCGQVYRYTTNPVVSTGDGYAIAQRAGARLADMEFVQFHPTALDTAENPLALVSEAVRGGATLLNGDQRFMPERHRLAGMARGTLLPGDLPRAAAHRSGSMRDRSAVLHRALPRHLRLRRAGIDPASTIPVTPPRTHMMAVISNLTGLRLPHLYACGSVHRRPRANRRIQPLLEAGLCRAARDLATVPRTESPRRAGRWFAGAPTAARRGWPRTIAR